MCISVFSVWDPRDPPKFPFPVHVANVVIGCASTSVGRDRQGELKAEPLDAFVKGLRDGKKCKDAIQTNALAREKGEEGVQLCVLHRLVTCGPLHVEHCTTNK